MKYDAAKVLEFIQGHSNHVLSLYKSGDNLQFSEKVASTVEGIKEMNVESSKIAEAICIIDQQKDLIRGLQQAQLNSVKVAAALTEAVKLAQDGAIDVGDVIDYAKSSLINGTVKLSSVDELFDQSPGEVIQGVETGGSKGQDQGIDILTQTLRGLSQTSH